MKSIAIHTAELSPGTVTLNGMVVFHSKTKTDPEFFKALYSKLDLAYPKFFKMDEVCKLCFLTVEFLLRVSNWKTNEGEHTDIVMGTTDGCLATDQRHLQSISGEKDSFPSPATFVYTLPNIMLGEVCIRHGITGENDCFIMPGFDHEFLEKYTNLLLRNDPTHYCITGYTNYKPKNYSCILTLFTTEKNS